jgi:hypothetical protein
VTAVFVSATVVIYHKQEALESLFQGPILWNSASGENFSGISFFFKNYNPMYTYVCTTTLYITRWDSISRLIIAQTELVPLDYAVRSFGLIFIDKISPKNADKDCLTVMGTTLGFNGTKK